MTFTQYLRHLASLGLAPSFSWMIDNLDVPWPEESLRLEEYEELVHQHCPHQWPREVLELRTLWSRWSSGPATSANLDADHALAAWRDYAVHLRTCGLTPQGGCSKAAALLARAAQESHFEDLERHGEDLGPGEDALEAELCQEAARLVAQILARPDLEHLRHHRPEPTPPWKH